MSIDLFTIAPLPRILPLCLLIPRWTGQSLTGETLIANIGRRQPAAISPTRKFPLSPTKNIHTQIPTVTNRTMGRQWRVYLSARRVYGCSRCKNHLSVVDSTVSKVSPDRRLKPINQLQTSIASDAYRSRGISGFQRPTWSRLPRRLCVSNDQHSKAR